MKYLYFLVAGLIVLTFEPRDAAAQSRSDRDGRVIVRDRDEPRGGTVAAKAMCAEAIATDHGKLGGARGRIDERQNGSMSAVTAASRSRPAISPLPANATSGTITVRQASSQRLDRAQIFAAAVSRMPSSSTAMADPAAIRFPSKTEEAEAWKTSSSPTIAEIGNQHRSLSFRLASQTTRLAAARH